VGIDGVGHGLSISNSHVVLGPRRFSTQLIVAFLAVLLVTSGAVAAVIRWQTLNNESINLQRLSAGLAQHIVGHWPVVTDIEPSDANKAEQDKLLDMLMTVNPAIQVYLLDAQGNVKTYLGDIKLVTCPQVDVEAIRQFLSGAALPIRGTDPMGDMSGKLFSAAMFPAKPGQTTPPGYLYVVLDGAARDSIAKQFNQPAWIWTLSAVALGCLLLALLAWIVIARRLAQPLNTLAEKMETYQAREPDRRNGSAGSAVTPVSKNEFARIDSAFNSMAARIEAQREQQQLQAQSHREAIAGIAHDLRTPLTALHGNLEALKIQAPNSERLLEVAIAQSDKVRRLSRQLFELAVLQSTTEPVSKERFNLDELISDTVQKFELSASNSLEVTLAGTPPGRVELEGDMQMIERAITNLIENAGQHGDGKTSVAVSIEKTAHEVQVLVSDNGPGLPPHLVSQLERRQTLKPSPQRKRTGGLGGLGLSIAQRIAILHGGHLLPVASTSRGTTLCFTLPLGPSKGAAKAHFHIVASS
jgi:signal transduction histidine kinase